MTIREVSIDEYADAIVRHPHTFNSPAFTRLNAYKADEVRCLLLDDGGHTRFGLIVGSRGGQLLSPFSAPFGGFSTNRRQSVEKVDEAVEALAAYAKKERKDIRVVLPPLFYDSDLIAPCINALSRRAQLKHVDLNYHFQVSKFEHYEECMERNARKNLKRALASDFEFHALNRDDTDGRRRAYDVIRRNRDEHGYPLRMSLADVESTIGIIPADFFLLTHKGEDVAAAQVFHVADGIAQVIYWGDLRAYSSLRPMNCLSFRIFEHYYRQGLRILDIGPSTEDGQPNFGLCDFKTSIGCDVSPKFVFELGGE